MLHRRVVGKRRAFLDLVVVEHRDTDPCHARPGETNGVLGRPTALRPMSRLVLHRGGLAASSRVEVARTRAAARGRATLGAVLVAAAPGS